MSNITLQQNYLPQTQEYSLLKEIAVTGFKSGLLPTSIKTQEAAIVIALKGRELGIPPMQAFSHINVISGKPTMSSELMLAQIFKCVPKAVINYVQTDSQGCIIDAARPNCKLSRFSFTKDDAEKAQLLSKDTWKKYPDAMYRARAISAMARALFPDALMGVSYTAEELGAEVELDESGSEVIRDVTPKEKPKNETAPIVETKKDEQKQTIDQKPTSTESNFLKYKIPSGSLKGKTFEEIELGQLDGYMDAIHFHYIDKEMPENIKYMFQMYKQFLDYKGIKKDSMPNVDK